MGGMKVSFPGLVAGHVLCLLAVLLQFVLPTEGQVYTISPQNLTSETGKTVTFECGVLGLTGNAKVRFSIIGPKVNSSVSCPGQNMLYLPAQSMRAHCESKSVGDVAVWSIAGTSEDDNGTVFVCQVPTLPDRLGYLYVFENSGYYGKLIGYVIGGFLAALVTVVVVYILLKRSERVRQCFRSVGGLNDGQTT